MKKIRILFALMLLVSFLAPPARADFFYCYKDGSSYKPAPMLYPGFAMYDYPKGVAATENPFMATFKVGDYEMLMISDWDTTNSAQYARFYTYQYSAWGMNSADPVKIPGSGQYPSDAAFLSSYLYLADRGALGSSGSLTIHNWSSETEFLENTGKVTFDSSQEKLSALLESNDVAHADALCVYNSTVYVLLSVQNGDVWKNNILATISYDGTNCTVSNAVKLNTKSNGYAQNSIYADISTGYILLASGNVIEKVTLSDSNSTQLVNQGISVEGWTGNFTDIARDSNDHTYIMCQSPVAEGTKTVLVYQISSTTLDAMVDGQITGEPIRSASGIAEDKDPFVMTDPQYTNIVSVCMCDIANTFYAYENGSAKDVFPTVGGDGYIYRPVGSMAIGNPSDTQLPDSGGGCNAGATAAMLAFCALPFVFRKKK